MSKIGIGHSGFALSLATSQDLLGGDCSWDCLLDEAKIPDLGRLDHKEMWRVDSGMESLKQQMIVMVEEDN